MFSFLRFINISIHAPREGSDCFILRELQKINISIHAPREGSDETSSKQISQTAQFLSTLPARGATPAGEYAPPGAGISIHAPREGSDRPGRKQAPNQNRNFYPRSPRGERPVGVIVVNFLVKFLSTLPARGATDVVVLWLPKIVYFYPRSPRGERRKFGGGVKEWLHFYPRSPRGERPIASLRRHLETYFYPRSPRGERHAPTVRLTSHWYFYPRSPRGERPNLCLISSGRALFLSTLPARGATRSTQRC